MFFWLHYTISNIRAKLLNRHKVKASTLEFVGYYAYRIFTRFPILEISLVSPASIPQGAFQPLATRNVIFHKHTSIISKLCAKLQGYIKNIPGLELSECLEVIDPQAFTPIRPCS